MASNVKYYKQTKKTIIHSLVNSSHSKMQLVSILMHHLKQTKTLMVSGETDNHCLLTT